ncbi:MAG: hypothetical protein GQ564_16810 [Bacteroidales bacterium]|nr:hypothetical protein [Bacteroidales bacterium]
MNWFSRFYFSISLVFTLTLFSTDIYGNSDTTRIIQLIDSADYYLEKHSDSAIYFGQNAILFSKKHNLHLYQANAKVTIGSYFKFKNVADSALHYYHSAIAIYDSLLQFCTNDIACEKLALALNNVSEIHADNGNLDKALLYNRRAEDVNKKHLDRNRQTSIFITRGKIEYINKDLSLAKKYWQVALKNSIEFNQTDFQGRMLNNLGSIYYWEEKYDSSLLYYEDAYLLQKSIANEVQLAKAANNMGFIHLIMKKYNIALNYSIEAELLSKKYNLIESRAKALHFLIEIYMYLNMPDKTHETFILFEEVLDEIYSIEATNKINELEIKYEVEKKDRELELLEKQKLIDKLEHEKSLKARNKIILLILSLSVIFSIIAYIIFLNYKKRQTIKKQQLEYDKIATEQKMLRSQMNPHFIFNSLNSIQSCISSGDTYEAEKYLADFANLMREILENSRVDAVLLDKEIEILQLYLQLEKLRFDKRFTYEFIIDDDLETDFISIPPMLIQPFIENAILHAFTGIDNGKIKISFVEENNMLICTIDDNGIGRKASVKNKVKSKHASLAISITEDRLKRLSEQMKVDAGFEIIDKVNKKTNKSDGTMIVIFIPCFDN